MTRISEAALALITRTNALGHAEYLAQWNNNWDAFSLIGGHVEEGETFRQACLREICEELECSRNEIDVALYAYSTLRFRENSRAAKLETDYHWQMFTARLADGVLQQLPDSCEWLAAESIRTGVPTTAGRFPSRSARFRRPLRMRNSVALERIYVDSLV